MQENEVRVLAGEPYFNIVHHILFLNVCLLFSFHMTDPTVILFENMADSVSTNIAYAICCIVSIERHLKYVFLTKAVL